MQTCSRGRRNDRERKRTVWKVGNDTVCIHVWQRLRDEKLQARLLLQVHDELIVEAPEEEIDEVKRILKEEMENVVHYSVPLTTEVGVGKTWLEAH